MHSLVNKGSYKPFIKWAGGKSRSVNKLLSLFPKNIDTYVEPFVGSGALYFKVNFKRAIINDLNFELICAYRQVRDNLEHLKSLLRTFKYDREMFLEVRAWDRSDDFKDKEELYHAARLIYLIKTCYNGLYRVNSKNHFNTPFGKDLRPNICDEVVLNRCSEYLNKFNTEIYNLSYQDLLDKIPAGAFVYLDPPYHPLSQTSNFTSYQSSSWSEKNQEELFAFCKQLHKRGIKFMQSNSSADFIIDLYKKDFRIDFIEVTRCINSDIKKRSPVKEVVIMNYDKKGRLLQ